MNLLIHVGNDFCRVEKPGPSRQSHKLKIAGSNPAPATSLWVSSDRIETIKLKPLSVTPLEHILLSSHVLRIPVAWFRARVVNGIFHARSFLHLNVNRRGKRLARLLAVSHKEWGLR